MLFLSSASTVGKLQQQRLPRCSTRTLPRMDCRERTRRCGALEAAMTGKQHLDEGHVGVHDVEAVLLYERAHQLDAPGVSRNLRTMTHGIGGSGHHLPLACIC